MTILLAGTAVAAAALLTLMAAISDARRYLILNIHCLGVLIAGVAYGLALGPDFPWVSHAGAAVLVFLVGALLFNLGLFGGGDVKLLTALSFWAGLDELFPFLLLVAVAGGALSVSAVLFFWLRQRGGKGGEEMQETALTIFAATQSRSVAEVAHTAETFSKFGFMKLRVPYGIAIALGSVYVFLRVVAHLGAIT